MTKILYFLTFSLLCTFSLKAQSNINVDSDCLNRNSLLLSRLLIKDLGEEKIKYFLENDIRFLIFYKVDSLGYTEFVRAKVFPDSLTNIVSREIDNQIKIRNNYFYVCYERFPNHTKESSLEIISRDLFKEQDYQFINVAFPGETMIMYNIEKDNANKKGKQLSKYEYLLTILNKNYP